MDYILITIIIFLLVSVYYNIKFALILIKMEDAIEESLDVLDERYASISKVLEIPLFFDSPQIRQVINDIKHTRNSILKVANIISDVDGEPDGDEESS